MYVPNKSILQNGTLIELTLSLFVIRIGLHRSRCVILLILLQINQLPALLFIILLHTNPWQFSALETCLSKNSNRTQIVILSSLLTFHTSFFITIYGTREVKISYTFSHLFLHIVLFQLPQNWCSYLYLGFKISTLQIVQQLKNSNMYDGVEYLAKAG